MTLGAYLSAGSLPANTPLYSDASCTQQVGTATGNGQPIINPTNKGAFTPVGSPVRPCPSSDLHLPSIIWHQTMHFLALVLVFSHCILMRTTGAFCSLHERRPTHISVLNVMRCLALLHSQKQRSSSCMH